MLEHWVRFSLIGVAFLVALAFSIEAGTFRFSAKHAPFWAGWTVTVLMGLMVTREIVRIVKVKRSGELAAVRKTLEHMEYESTLSKQTGVDTLRYFGWVLAYLAAIGLVGFKIASVLFVAIFFLREAKMRPVNVGISLVVVIAVIQFFEWSLNFQWPPSLLF